MAELTVPKKFYGGLAKLLSLPDSVFQELISQIKSAKPGELARTTLGEAVSRVHSIAASDAPKIADALMSVYIADANSDVPTDELISEMAESIIENESNELELVQPTLNQVASRLAEILNIEKIAVAAKAYNIIYEHDRVFAKARVLTDIRPVFGKSIEDLPRAALVNHTLSLHYLHDGEHEEFFVAMDSMDIDGLMEVLERAKAKGESLKTMLAKSGIPYIEPH